MDWGDKPAIRPLAAPGHGQVLARAVVAETLATVDRMCELLRKGQLVEADREKARHYDVVQQMCTEMVSGMQRTIDELLCLQIQLQNVTPRVQVIAKRELA